jgi:hypothetical protein
MKNIYQKSPEERKLLSFQNSVNTYYKTLEIHTKNLILMYESGDDYDLGLQFIQNSLVLIKSYDEEKYSELNELLSQKIDSSVSES